MSIANIFKMVHRNYRLEELKRVDEEFYSEIQDRIVEEYRDVDKVKEKMSSIGLEFRNLMWEPYMGNLYYVEEYLVIPLHAMMSLSMMDEKLVNNLREVYRQELDTGDWFNILAKLPEGLRMDVFNKCYTKMSEEQAVEAFEWMYTSLDYPMEVLDKDIVMRVMKKGTCVEVLRKYADKQGYVTVYRGQTEKSTKLDKAISYSISYDVASKFASHFQSKGAKVYKAKVKLEDIRMYSDDRLEQEVLVDYKDLKDIEDMGVYGLEDLIVALPVYQEKKYYNEKYNLLDKEPIHGFNHSNRMIMLASLLYSKMKRKLKVSDLNILVAACVAHDLGREHDGADWSHGLLSEQILSKELVKECKLTEEDEKILRFVIINHSLPDSKVEMNIKKSDVKDKVRLKKLAYLFKDIDGLDRVRIRDLDSRYLRAEEAKKAVTAAHMVLSLVK